MRTSELTLAVKGRPKMRQKPSNLQWLLLIPFYGLLSELVQHNYCKWIALAAVLVWNLTSRTARKITDTLRLESNKGVGTKNLRKFQTSITLLLNDELKMQLLTFIKQLYRVRFATYLLASQIFVLTRRGALNLWKPIFFSAKFSAIHTA